jgi:hypothetical protein
MALFQLGAFGVSLRGKSGNTVFAKTKSGIVVRDRVIPSNPNTDAQLLVRRYMTVATNTYSNLSPAHQAAWKQYATRFKKRSKSGVLKEQSAINVFAALATKYLLVNNGGEPPEDPPLSNYTGDSITVTATASAGKVTFTASAANAAGTKTELLLQPIPNAKRKPASNGYRTKAYVAFSSGNLSYEVSVPAGYYAAGYRFVSTATGQDTRMVTLPVQTVAMSVAQGGKDAGQSGSKKAA